MVGGKKTGKESAVSYETGIDLRLDFVYEYITRTFKCKMDRWVKMLATPEYKALLLHFFDHLDCMLVVITLNSSGVLTVAEDYPTVCRTKSCYFIKKVPTTMGKESENTKDWIIYGDLSHQALDHLVIGIEEVMNPVVSSEAKDPRWPDTLVHEVEDRCENLSGVLRGIQGQLKGKTWLPFPDNLQRLSDDPENTVLKSAVEELVVKWSHQISDILLEDSSLSTSGPLSQQMPLAELNFWEERAEDLQCIYDQMTVPKVNQTVQILKTTRSHYWLSYATMFRNVQSALNEAQNVLIFLRPLRRHIDALQTAAFDNILTPIRPLMHAVCFVWAYSPTYSTPSRIIILLRRICNLIIEMARNFLCGSLIFQSEPEEAFNKSRLVVQTLETFRDIYEAHKADMWVYFDKGTEVKPWDFLPELVFARFSKFTDKIRRLEKLFETTVEMYKLDKVEIGGSKGRALGGIVVQLHEEFTEYYQRFSNVTYDCTDADDTKFELDIIFFEEKVTDIDRRLSNVVLSAFDDCHTPEAAYKLIHILGPLLDRPTIQTDLQPKFLFYVQLLEEEMTSVMEQFNEVVLHVSEANRGRVFQRSFPPYSAAIYWAKAVQERVDISQEQFKGLELFIQPTRRLQRLEELYEEFTETMEDFQRKMFHKWEGLVRNEAESYLDENLFELEDEGKIFVNFSHKFAGALKEVRYIKTAGYVDIPAQAEALYEQRTSLRKHVRFLSRISLVYNDILDGLSQVESLVLEQRLDALSRRLMDGVNTIRWRDGADIEKFYEQLQLPLEDLRQRLKKSQENMKTIETIVSEWTAEPLFIRLGGKNENLLDVEETAVERRNARFVQITESSLRIQELMEANEELLKDDSVPDQLWEDYLKAADDLVKDGLIKMAAISLGYLMDHTDSFLTPALFLQVSMQLNDSILEFEPALEPDNEDSFVNQMESILAAVYHQGALVARVATCDEHNYLSALEQDPDLRGMHNDIMERVEVVANKSLEYVKRFDEFAYIYEDDREEHLTNFLKTGTMNPPEKTDPYGDDDPEEPATLEQFRLAIDKFEQTRIHIQSFEPEVIFERWFRLDVRHFRDTLAKTVIEWSFMFKQHLMDSVVNGLNQLEEFINEAQTGLGQALLDGDISVLISVMSLLHRIKHRTKATDEMFPPIKEYIDLLKSYDYELPESVFVQLEELPGRWQELKSQAKTVKVQVAPLQANEVSSIRKRIIEFDVKQVSFREQFRHAEFFQPNSAFPYDELNHSEHDVREYEKVYDEICSAAKLFEVVVPEPKALRQCRREIRLAKGLWDYMAIVEATVADWKMSPWQAIDAEFMDMECKRMAKEVKAMDKDVKLWELYLKLEATIRNIISSLKTVTELQNPSIKDRHWEELLSSTKIAPRLIPKLIDKFVREPTTTFADLYSIGLHNFEEEVKNVVDKAVKESSMEKTLKELDDTWKSQEYQFEVHPRTGTKLIKTSEELIEVLEDNQVQLQNIAMSKYISFFREQVDFWQSQLSQADNVLSTVVEVQRTWSHLESIFITTEDIRKSLPEHSAKFDQIDLDFKATLERLYTTTNVVQGTNQPGILSSLETIQADLTICEKALAEYLETKRIAFPRFYFISSSDLLDILSSGNEPSHIGRHLTKLFDSIAGLVFSGEDEKSRRIARAMRAKDGEVVDFQGICNCTGGVEAWLNTIESIMRLTIRHYLGIAVVAYEQEQRHIWIQGYPAQVALCGTQIWWTTEVNLAFSKLEDGNEGALKNYFRKQVFQLNSLISLLVGELTAQQRQKIMTICTIDVHSRDVVGKLIQMRVDCAQAFQWQSQLRHRWDPEQGECFSNICDAELMYQNEYLGNTPRLVITPLTDRCYITLTQSLHLILGGAPAGPAGTGKTETTKDLGRALGSMVYVFNCSEQMDYRSVGSIFKGLAMTGAWGCFDEFNRISVEVLSVIAVQVKSIQDAIRDHKTKFNFMGEDIGLTPTVGIFITMNPGYAGRSELPENLKVLFRPCAMVVPDFELICEIMLVAEGFQDARVLARKFITLYTLCKELLSKQDHYDWGLRAIKSVLVVAGSLKRADSGRPEDEVLMRALRDFNVPKIISDDIPVFMGLIGDLFPALDVPRKIDIEFEDTVKMASKQLNLQPDENFILKVVQLTELFDVRHSVFIVGNAGTGKTQVWKTLFKTYANMGRKPMYDDLNPKAVTNDELFGVINPSTREWKDGIFSVLMREQANMAGEGPKWIVLDGDIDPMWIESLNTVMDDNKVLTLASNERISLTKSMRLIFEIHTLKHATPATVSRAGILYLNPGDLAWNAYVTTWLSTREDENERANLSILFEKYVPSTQEVLRSRFRRITPIPEINNVEQLCNLLETLLTEDNTPPDCPKDWLETYFVFACIWAFGSSLHVDQTSDLRLEFSKWWLSEWKFVKFPQNQPLSVFDYYIDQETKKFLPWTEMTPKFDLDPDVPLQATLVPTAETTRLKYFMNLLIDKAKPIMLVGIAGSGKTVLINDLLASLPESFAVANVPFNFYTTSEMLQRVLERPLEKKAGRNYGPCGNKRLVYFIDDMNMPMVDEYETVQPHTLIRQHLDYGHWYDRIKITLKDVHNVQYVSCMNPTAGSFVINPRLQRHFAVFSVGFPGPASLLTIYKTILHQHLSIQVPNNGTLRKMATNLTTAALVLHAKVAQSFIPTAVKFHYVFNLRDLSNVFQGLMFSSSDCLRNPTDLIRLWMHESNRVYADKLVDEKDISNFTKFLYDVFKKFFEDMDEASALAKPLIYYHFALGPGEAKYMPVADFGSVHRFLTDSLKSYNEFNSIMNLVLFEAAINYICRISRILESPRGNGLLIGVGGSGKQSLSRLAAFLSGLDVYQITLRKGYGVIDLRTDLAGLYLKAGLKNLGTMFLMTDAQVAQEHFLVLINDMLASGEIIDLLPDDEVENVISGMRSEVKGVGMQDTRENCWKFFIDRVRKTLKTILCFSPVGSTLRNRARKFPALINCTSVLWFHEWPEDALISVSQRFVKDIEVLPLDFHEPIASFMAFVHMSVSDMSKLYLANERRYNYTTPKSFLEQIACYSKLVSSKTEQAISRANRLEKGLIKLETCAQQVEELKKTLAVQEVDLKEKNDKADELIKIVASETEKVKQEKENAAKEEANVANVAEEVSKIQAVCQVELEKAEPALEAAYAALNTLNKTNLTELKTFTTPPTDVVNVVAAVFILWEGTTKSRLPKDRSWKVTKSQMMGDVGKFLEGLQNLNKEAITQAVVDALKPYINDPGFQPELIRSKSFAASGLCSYVINVLKFNEVFQDVAPKRRALQEATDELNSNLETLSSLQAQISKLEGKLATLTTEFESATAAKMRCQAEADKTTATIDLANRLVGGLASEKIRWIQNVHNYRESTKTIPGDMLIVTAFVSYVGCFTKKYRLDLLEKTWIPHLRKMSPGVPMSGDVDPLSVLTEDAQIADWNTCGLPSDRMSSENATILVSSQRWPLMIDPQLQGIKWIKNMFGKDLKVIRLGQKGYLDVIEVAISKGQTVLLESIPESVDPVLEPLLARNLIKKGTAIKMGDREIDYNANFRLILQTKLANPHYQPEMQAQTTLINFTVTRDGLEDQLLAEVVKVERPDLEQQKSQLTQQQYEFNALLRKLEDDLLQRLQSAEGDFLEDDSLVNNLEVTKRTALEVEVKAKEATITSSNINAAREQYRPAAARASLLYFILNDLNKINPIYQFSLKAFSTVFHNAIKMATSNKDIGRRVINLIDAITYSVWLYTNRGLFERDKLIFTAQVAFQIQIQQEAVNMKDMEFLLRLPITPNVISPVDFVSRTGYGALKSLTALEDFRGIDRDIESRVKEWRHFAQSECPEREPLPGEWRSRKGVQRLCIMRCFRPDRMTHALSIFVEETLGVKYVRSVRLDFGKSYSETSQETPVFFILSPGVDPLHDVEMLGKTLGYTADNGNFHNVSLGQGQEIVAEKALEEASKEGHWVILQNIHLVARWLSRLEKKLEQNCLSAREEYRVFLSSEPAGNLIPQGILESSIKITNEAPTGMQANIHKALDNFNQDHLENCSKELEFKAILFSLCYFHAVVAERRKFGTQGWNRIYPFNTGDLTICVNVLHNYLESNTKVPWEDLRYLFGEIMYGGHITDDWDRRLCRTYLEEYMMQELLDGEIQYAPGFPAPPSTDLSGYHTYIDEYLPPESPYLYGLHPNAEIGFLSATSDTLFKTILELQPRDPGASGEQTMTKEEKVKQVLDDIVEKLPDAFNMMDIMGRAEEKTPYVIVALQECERMNMLTNLMRTSLKELDLGLKGELTITSEMEDLSNAIFMDQVPPSWLKHAYPSTLGLGSWYADLLLRSRELETWTSDFILPPAVWLAGFFNPQSFLTAIMQSTARRQELPLDKMCLQCDVTKKTREETTSAPKEGACIHGLFMEGARWDIATGSIADSKSKDLYPSIPVIFLKAVTQDKLDSRNAYDCPVYKTKGRGPTYVWTFNLRTKEKPGIWVLAGVAILLQV